MLFFFILLCNNQLTPESKQLYQWHYLTHTLALKEAHPVLLSLDYTGTTPHDQIRITPISIEKKKKLLQP